MTSPIRHRIQKTREQEDSIGIFRCCWCGRESRCGGKATPGERDAQIYVIYDMLMRCIWKSPLPIFDCFGGFESILFSPQRPQSDTES